MGPSNEASPKDWVPPIYFLWVEQPAQAQLAPQEQESPHILMVGLLFECSNELFCVAKGEMYFSLLW